MSYQVPSEYPELSSALNIPHALTGDDLKVFAGARSMVRYVQAASGQNVGAGSNVLFNIPAEPYGFIKPSSMYFHGQVAVTQSNGNDTFWAFAGQPNPALTTGNAPSAAEYGIWYANQTSSSIPARGVGVKNATTGALVANGGACSLINRISVTLPGGSSMTYNQHHHWRNAVTPHCLSKPYIEGELKQLEGGAICLNINASTTNTTRNFTVPMDIPLFTADAAFPLLLCNGGLTIEMTTNSVNEAFISSVSDVTGYSLTGLSLVYEVITVTPEFKSALVEAKRASPYLIHVNDRMSIGPVSSSSSQRFNLGVSLSSLKSVLFTEMPLSQLQGTTYSITGAGPAALKVPLDKFYGCTQITQYNVYRDGIQVTPNYLTSDDIWFAELTRALSRITDTTNSSLLYNVVPLDGSTERTNYSRSQLLLGASMRTVDDWAFSSTGIPVDQLSIEVTKSLLSNTSGAAINIGYTGTAASAGAGIPVANMYIWACFDSVVVILPDGMCTIRR